MVGKTQQQRVGFVLVYFMCCLSEIYVFQFQNVGLQVEKLMDSGKKT